MKFITMFRRMSLLDSEPMEILAVLQLLLVFFVKIWAP